MHVHIHDFVFLLVAKLPIHIGLTQVNKQLYEAHKLTDLVIDDDLPQRAPRRLDYTDSIRSCS